MSLFFIFLALSLGGYFIYRFVIETVNRKSSIFQYCCLLVYCLALLIFTVSLSEAAEYYKQIRIYDAFYTPLARKHLATPAVFFALSVIAGFTLWLKGRLMPPLLFVICLVFSIAGIGLCIALLLQVSSNADNQTEETFVFLPVVHIILSLLIILFRIRESAKLSVQKVYSNSILNFLNRLLVNAYLQPVWVLVLLLPVSTVLVLVLTLFGQDPHAMTKVFTDTTTWHFSQQQHPPFLEYQGHYLCTVAARGHAKLVKPIRFGHRRGNIILINRQLLVANAFEELLEEHCSSLHRLVRRLYDRYGFPLSRYIMKPVHSDIVYLLMKPLEYFFVFVLYLCCTSPEEIIAKQYTSNH